ncbi:DUF2339 domain-containing protein [Halobacteriovorax sp.]|uniref:DUF2339 domain-containing protein n=1 Tax=Halobacteriovorax sp. TaxID=2020862 RepID=UPI003AF220A5
MNSNTLDRVLERLNEIEKRIDKIENKSQEIIRKKYTPPPTTLRPQENTKKDPLPRNKESNVLGYIGAACILLASILLIKLSIDSGWLTPTKQCLIATIISISLIFLPFYISNKDRAYMSILPAIGVASLHLIAYGAVFYHNLLDPVFGLIAISAIGILSLWLLVKLKEETYAVIAILGTYIGASFFHSSFTNLSLMAVYLAAWDIAFSSFAIKTRKRGIIIISAYLALGLVSFFGLTKGISNPDINFKIMIVQAIQFGVFSLSTILFSIKNNIKLTLNEAWSYFPLVIFFYGQEYFFINRTSPNWATLFSIIFGIFLLSIYTIAKKKLHNRKLESGGVVYTLCSFIFAHSIYLVEMSDHFKLYFAFVLIGTLMYFRKYLSKNSDLQGPLAIAILILAHCYLSILTGIANIHLNSMLFFGLSFGSLLLYFSKFLNNSKADIILYLAHAQIFIFLFRLKTVIGHFAIAPLWIIYAFGILIWSYKRRDINMANGAIPLIILGLLRFIFFDFSELKGVQQVSSLLIMGILIFVSGFIYRKVKTDANDQSSALESFN